MDTKLLVIIPVVVPSPLQDSNIGVVRALTACKLKDKRRLGKNAVGNHAALAFNSCFSNHTCLLHLASPQPPYHLLCFKCIRLSPGTSCFFLNCCTLSGQVDYPARQHSNCLILSKLCICPHLKEMLWKQRLWHHSTISRLIPNVLELQL